VNHARAARLSEAEIDGWALLGCAQRDLGDFVSAEAAGQGALTLAYARGNDYSAAQCLHFLSLVSYNRNDLAQALERSKRAQEIKALIGDFEGLVACRLVETLILSSRDQLDSALASVSRAVTDSQLLENPWLRSLAHYAVAVVHTFRGNLTAAEAYLNQALAEKTFNLDLPYLASMLTFWGYLYVAQGRYADALQLVQAPLPKGGGLEVELMRGVIQGMALLGQGDGDGCRRVATQLANRARQSGYRLYLAEAEQLLRLSANPPPQHELVRRVCCILREKSQEKL
jgi:tetratricopeptide (TPR) repeat protein